MTSEALAERLLARATLLTSHKTEKNHVVWTVAWVKKVGGSGVAYTLWTSHDVAWIPEGMALEVLLDDAETWADVPRWIRNTLGEDGEKRHAELKKGGAGWTGRSYSFKLLDTAAGPVRCYE